MDNLSKINKQDSDILSEKHKQELNDSIRYASYIQKALLPSQKEIDRFLPQNFIYYLPKDIVSGDFYWFHQLKNEIAFAAADCTGHGVPGAFMSMLGISVLNQIVLSHKNISAGNILDLLREHIMKSLNQTGASGEMQDGMDIALGIIDVSNNELQFAGAFNPLFHVRKGIITKYEGDRMPIGIDPIEERPFKTHKINLEPEDMLYVFSDGYSDQFGGNEGKKFKIKEFRNLLCNIAELELPDQKQIIHEKFMSWKGEYHQVDDVLIMGIRYLIEKD